MNSVVPAIMAGNAVMLKHSAQTPLCAERFAECFREAGLPDGVFQVLHMSHEDTERVIRDPRVDFVAFTGSVAGGHAVQRAAAERFIGTGLELGGCDPAYVRHDAEPRARGREPRRRRVLQLAASPAAASSASTCTSASTTRSSTASIDAHPPVPCSAIRSDADTTLGPVVRTAAADTIRAPDRG